MPQYPRCSTCFLHRFWTSSSAVHLCHPFLCLPLASRAFNQKSSRQVRTRILARRPHSRHPRQDRSQVMMKGRHQRLHRRDRDRDRQQEALSAKMILSGTLPRRQAVVRVAAAVCSMAVGLAWMVRRRGRWRGGEGGREIVYQSVEGKRSLFVLICFLL